jgi:protease-4
MTAAQREMTEALVAGHYAEVVEAIASARRLPADEVRAAVDDGLLTGTAARARRLVDDLAFEDQLPALLGGGTPVTIQPWAQARVRLRRPYRWPSLHRPAIGVVQLVGAIVPGESRELPVPLPLLGQHLAGHETIARAFRAAERHPAVQAVVFHVDSGGGSAVASEMIWREVARLQQRKPVVVFMGNVAGSGGYYVACGARHIVAGASTITGSIGVVAGKLNLSGLFARAGLRREIVSRGATAGMLSAFTDFTEREWGVLRGWMEEIYGRFIGRVAEGRRQDPPAIRRIAGGRVYTGRQALELGLVDELGDFEAALRKAKALAGIPEDAEVPVLTIRPPRHAPIPEAPAAAWLDALGAAARLLQEPALLLAPVDGIGG